MPTGLEQRVKVEWGKAKGFYWNDFLEEVGNISRKRKERTRKTLSMHYVV